MSFKPRPTTCRDWTTGWRPMARARLARRAAVSTPAPGTSCDAFDAFDAQTSRDFWEVGASGQCYSRGCVRSGLQKRYAAPPTPPNLVAVLRGQVVALLRPGTLPIQGDYLLAEHTHLSTEKAAAAGLPAGPDQRRRVGDRHRAVPAPGHPGVRRSWPQRQRRTPPGLDGQVRHYRDATGFRWMPSERPTPVSGLLSRLSSARRPSRPAPRHC